MAIKNGREYLVYFATAAPTDANDSTDAAYADCAFCTSLSINGSVNLVDISNKDSGDVSEYLGGRSDHDVSIGFRFDAAGDAGQQKAQTAMDSSTKNIWFLITTDTASDLEWLAKGVLSGLSFSADDDAPTEGTVDIKVTGTLTVDTVT